MANIQREHGVTAPGLGSFQKLDGGARGLRGLRLELAWGGWLDYKEQECVYAYK